MVANNEVYGDYNDDDDDDDDAEDDDLHVKHPSYLKVGT